MHAFVKCNKILSCKIVLKLHPKQEIKYKLSYDKLNSLELLTQFLSFYFMSNEIQNLHNKKLNN